MHVAFSSGMKNLNDAKTSGLPVMEMRRLEFLTGEFHGLETMVPPGGEQVSFQAHSTGTWESCDRFLTHDYYASIPGLGVETLRGILTFVASINAYRMWIFASGSEHPIVLTGNFHGDTLILIGEPSETRHGLQKMRIVFEPTSGPGFHMVGERWELDGYVPYFDVTMRP